MSYAAKMQALENAVAAVDDARVGGDPIAYAWWSALVSVIGSGWDNAADTMRDEGEPENEERRAELAYGSICCSSVFDSREDVRAWFKAAGYEW